MVSSTWRAQLAAQAVSLWRRLHWQTRIRRPPQHCQFAIKITELLAGTVAIGSAAADGEIVGADAGAGAGAGTGAGASAGAGAGPGSANVEDKPPAQDCKTNFKVNSVVLAIISD